MKWDLGCKNTREGLEELFLGTLAGKSVKAFLREVPELRWGFSGGSDGKESACNVGDLGSIPGSGRSLEKEMEIHASILTWKIP